MMRQTVKQAILYAFKTMLTVTLLFATQELRADTPGQHKPHKHKKQVYTVVEEPPEFPGGIAAMKEFIASNLQYPPEASGACVMGKVILRFIVTKRGKITGIEVLRSLHPAFDAEAVRVVKKMPRWKPGRLKGKAVDVYYILPVAFGYY